MLLQQVGDRLDNFVAGIVAIPVVDRLEKVDVYHQQGQRLPKPLEPRPFHVGEFHKISPIV
jgi:hypothetical protein